jgi:hypothetical protein
LFKKSLALLLALVLVLGVFAGCGQQEEPAPADDATTEESMEAATAAEVIKDYNVRMALTLAIDRTAIVETVTKGGQLPATGFVPPGLKDSTGKDFRATAGDYGIDPMAANVEEAIASCRSWLSRWRRFPNAELNLQYIRKPQSDC